MPVAMLTRLNYRGLAQAEETLSPQSERKSPRNDGPSRRRRHFRAAIRPVTIFRPECLSFRDWIPCIVGFGLVMTRLAAFLRNAPAHESLPHAPPHLRDGSEDSPIPKQPGGRFCRQTADDGRHRDCRPIAVFQIPAGLTHGAALTSTLFEYGIPPRQLVLQPSPPASRSATGLGRCSHEAE